MIVPQFYLNHVRQMREAACLSLDSGINADHTLHLQLYAEELDEFLKACAEGDKRAKADALGDVVVVASGYHLDAGEHARINFKRAVEHAALAATVEGINLPGAFLLIHESNMSKLCHEDQLEPTRLKYAAQGIDVEFRPAGEGLWSPFALNSNGAIPAGKWLKGVGYHEPDWSKLEAWRL